ncbi:hypothetical protein ACCD06_26630 [Azospirillum sp. CT11-132]|uniref:hypothetical protein n=1 Tax=Azospirillum sp. CT11-132 TaxID=3396317 RepID=UPI0039A5C350
MMIGHFLKAAALGMVAASLAAPVTAGAAAAEGPSARVSAADLLIDPAGLRGRSVEVSGAVAAFANIFQMQDERSGQGIQFSSNDRNIRAFLLNNCTIRSDSEPLKCDGQLTGQVGAGPFLDRIDSIALRARATGERVQWPAAAVPQVVARPPAGPSAIPQTVPVPAPAGDRALVDDATIADQAARIARLYKTGGLKGLEREVTACSREATADTPSLPRVRACFAAEIASAIVAIPQTDGRKGIPGLLIRSSYEERLKDQLDTLGVVGADRPAVLAGMVARVTAALPAELRPKAGKFTFPGAHAAADGVANGVPLQGDPAVKGEVYEGMTDGADGSLFLREKGNGGYFVSMGMGSRNCAGSIRGHATVHGNSLILRLKEVADMPDCVLTVRKSGRTVTVSEEHCMGFHGASCAFDGTLTRKQ